MTTTARWDMHVHSRYSWDGHAESTIDALSAAAARHGLAGIAITDHVDCPCSQRDQREVGRADLKTRARDLAQVRQSPVTVLSAVELGEPHLKPAEANDLRHRHGLQFVIGSVHSVVYQRDRVPVEHLGALLDPVVLMDYYLDEVLQMLDVRADIDVVGHLGYPLRSAGRLPNLNAGLIAKMREIVSRTTRDDIAIEINARDPRLFYDMLWTAVPEIENVTVTIGSDAHRLDGIENHSVSGVRQELHRRGFRPHPTQQGRLVATSG
ncbi:PHP domain-containing protein [Mycolicibacterium sp.]|uniref:PHP domain-containing protein n=1 Tax=Mycolicibacterium sp. TaxID=2320850 RepID=UPI0037CCA906